MRNPPEGEHKVLGSEPVVEDFVLGAIEHSCSKSYEDVPIFAARLAITEPTRMVEVQTSVATLTP